MAVEESIALLINGIKVFDRFTTKPFKEFSLDQFLLLKSFHCVHIYLLVGDFDGIISKFRCRIDY